MFELFGNPETVDCRCLVPKFSWLLWKFPPMSTLKAILLLKVCWNTIKPLLPGFSPHPEVNVSFKLMAQKECCVTLSTVHCVLFLAVFLRWKNRVLHVWSCTFQYKRDLNNRRLSSKTAEEACKPFRIYSIYFFLFLARTAINIMHQSVMTEFFHSCDEACDSHNLMEY